MISKYVSYKKQAFARDYALINVVLFSLITVSLFWRNSVFFCMKGYINLCTTDNIYVNFDYV